MSHWLPLGALGLVLLGLEVARRDRRFLALRLAALACVLCGATLLLRPRAGASAPGSLTLLTPGAPRGAAGDYRVDDLAGPGPGLVRLPGALGDSLRQARAVTLVGWGLLPSEWEAMPAGTVSFTPAALPAGITRLDAPQALALGEAYPLAGVVHLDPGGTGILRLRRDSMVVDSARVTATDPAFTLHDRPRAAGLAEYALELIAAGVTVREPLGVLVTRRAPPRVLVLEGSPSFETGFLKRWLAGEGGRVSVRTQVSRGRFRTEHLNGEGPALGAITQAVLSPFDVVVADGPALAALPEGERGALRRAVQESAGLVVVPPLGSGMAPLAGFMPGVRLEPRGEEPLRTARPRWAGQPRRPEGGIGVEAGALTAPGAERLVQEEDGSVLAVARPLGAGAVVATLVAAPSRWVLDGEADLYAGYWSRLLGRVARDTTSRLAWTSDGPLRPGRGLTLTLVTAAAAPALTVRAPDGSADTVALAQDPVDPRRWSGRYWPRDTGWHHADAGSARLAFHVHASTAWLALEAATRDRATRLALTAHAGTVTPSLTTRNPGDLLGFLLVVAGATLLWWEHRRR